MDIFKNYESIWRSIIRPTRQTYSISDLGFNVIFTREREKVRRIDFDLKNLSGLTLKCSYYEFADRPRALAPCVLYLHCNSGSRLEGQLYVDALINKGISVCIFDFAGSGLSDGEYISLGFYELADVQVVVNHLKINFGITKIAIWGRSMGAVTGLMYIANDETITAGVFDSPFSNFMKLAAEIGQQKSGLPKFLVKGALSLLQSTILEKAKFKIEELNVMKTIDRCKAPCLFVASKKDNFVKYHHSEKLHHHYKGKSTIIYFDGDHNEQRPQRIVSQCVEFFEAHFFPKQQPNLLTITKANETSQPIQRMRINSVQLSQNFSTSLMCGAPLNIDNYESKQICSNSTIVPSSQQQKQENMENGSFNPLMTRQTTPNVHVSFERKPTSNAMKPTQTIPCTSFERKSIPNLATTFDKKPTLQNQNQIRPLFKNIDSIHPQQKTIDSTIPLQKTIDLTIPQQKTIDSTISLPKTIDSTIPLQKTIDSTISQHKTTDSTIILKKTTDSTILLKKTTDSTILLKKTIDSTTLLQKNIDSTTPLQKTIDSTIPLKKTIDSIIPQKNTIDSTIPQKNTIDSTIPLQKTIDLTINQINDANSCNSPSVQQNEMNYQQSPINSQSNQMRISISVQPKCITKIGKGSYLKQQASSSDQQIQGSSNSSASLMAPKQVNQEQKVILNQNMAPSLLGQNYSNLEFDQQSSNESLQEGEQRNKSNSRSLSKHLPSSVNFQFVNSPINEIKCNVPQQQQNTNVLQPNDRSPKEPASIKFILSRSIHNQNGQHSNQNGNSFTSFTNQYGTDDPSPQTSNVSLNSLQSASALESVSEASEGHRYRAITMDMITPQITEQINTDQRGISYKIIRHRSQHRQQENNLQQSVIQRKNSASAKKEDSNWNEIHIQDRNSKGSLGSQTYKNERIEVDNMKRPAAKISIAEGDTESIISCDSQIMNQSNIHLISRNSSSSNTHPIVVQQQYNNNEGSNSTNEFKHKSLLTNKDVNIFKSDYSENNCITPRTQISQISNNNVTLSSSYQKTMTNKYNCIASAQKNQFEPSQFTSDIQIKNNSNGGNKFNEKTTAMRDSFLGGGGEGQSNVQIFKPTHSLQGGSINNKPKATPITAITAPTASSTITTTTTIPIVGQGFHTKHSSIGKASQLSNCTILQSGFGAAGQMVTPRAETAAPTYISDVFSGNASKINISLNASGQKINSSTESGVIRSNFVGNNKPNSPHENKIQVGPGGGLTPKCGYILNNHSKVIKQTPSNHLEDKLAEPIQNKNTLIDITSSNTPQHQKSTPNQLHPQAVNFPISSHYFNPTSTNSQELESSPNCQKRQQPRGSQPHIQGINKNDQQEMTLNQRSSGSHSKNSCKFDFKNKRSTNNVPVQRVKFSKNENVSPFSIIDIVSSKNSEDICHQKGNGQIHPRLNIDPCTKQNIESYSIKKFETYFKANIDGYSRQSIESSKQDDQSKQKDENSYIKGRSDSNSSKFKQNQLSSEKEKPNAFQPGSEYNTLTPHQHQLVPSDSEVCKKNRSSTTPVFKPDFIKNLQNTKVVQVFSKNDDIIILTKNFSKPDLSLTLPPQQKASTQSSSAIPFSNAYKHMY